MHHQPYREYSRNMLFIRAPLKIICTIKSYCLLLIPKSLIPFAYNIQVMQEFSFQILAGKSYITYTINAMYHTRLEKTYYFCASWNTRDFVSRAHVLAAFYRIYK